MDDLYLLCSQRIFFIHRTSSAKQSCLSIFMPPWRPSIGCSFKEFTSMASWLPMFLTGERHSRCTTLLAGVSWLFFGSQFSPTFTVNESLSFTRMIQTQGAIYVRFWKGFQKLPPTYKFTNGVKPRALLCLMIFMKSPKFPFCTQKVSCYDEKHFTCSFCSFATGTYNDLRGHNGDVSPGTMLERLQWPGWDLDFAGTYDLRFVCKRSVRFVDIGHCKPGFCETSIHCYFGCTMFHAYNIIPWTKEKHISTKNRHC